MSFIFYLYSLLYWLISQFVAANKLNAIRDNHNVHVFWSTSSRLMADFGDLTGAIISLIIQHKVHRFLVCRSPSGCILVGSIEIHSLSLYL